MLLSEAIRRGSADVLHERYFTYRHDHSGKIVGACALGGAALAANIAMQGWDVFVKTFPILEKVVHHPVHGHRSDTLRTVVISLNTSWSRKRIADWVATQEETS